MTGGYCISAFVFKTSVPHRLGGLVLLLRHGLGLLGQGRAELLQSFAVEDLRNQHGGTSAPGRSRLGKSLGLLLLVPAVASARDLDFLKQKQKKSFRACKR